MQQDKHSSTSDTAQQSGGLKTKIVLVVLWIAPLLFFVLWFFITLAPAPEKLPTPYIKPPVAVSKTQGVHSELSLSQDGKTLLYLVEQADKKQLILQSGADQSVLLAEDNTLQTAALSPDGQQVLWVKQHATSCVVEWFAIKVSEQKKTVAKCSPDPRVKLSWQQDSQGFYLLDRAAETQPYALSHYRLDTAAQKPVQLPLAAEHPTAELAMAESDDGQKLAVLHALDNQQSLLLLLDSQSFAVLQQKTLPLKASAIDWLGDSLLLSHDAELLQYKPNTDQLNFLFYTGRTVQSLAVVGQQIYYADYQKDTDIWQHDLTTNKARIRIGSSKVDRMPQVNHKGDLAFLSQRAGKEQIWLQPAGQNEYQLADLPGVPAFVRLQWSPDGQSLLFVKDGALWQLMVSSGQSRILLAPEKKVTTANWTADGTGIIYNSEQSGSSELWQLDLQTATSTVLTQQGGYFGYLLEQKLYFTKVQHDGLFVRDVTTGQEQLLIAEFDKTNGQSWSLSDGSLYYIQPGQGIRRYQLDTQHNSLLLATPERFVADYQLNNQQLFYVKAGLAKGDIYKLEPVSDTRK